MLKSSICVFAVAVLSLGGCATVTMNPGATGGETSVSIQQSAIRTAASDFTETAAERGWIERDRGMLQYARILAHGNDAVAADAATTSYASKIGVGERAAVSLVLSMATDANDAAELLSNMSRDALAFLTMDRSERDATSRTDLVTFERTLVQAQKTRRVFVKTLADIAADDTSAMDAAIAKFDRQIDRASTIADRLAREYAGRNVAAVS